MNRLYQGDNLAILQEIPDASIDLIATDPPFNTGRDWGAFNDKWEGGIKGYLKFMEARCVEMHRVLKDTGSFYLHCNPTASHYLKVMLDGVFGIKQFRDEIVWKRTNSHSDSKLFGSIHDIILFYSKSGNVVFNSPFKLLTKSEKLKKFPLIDENGRKYNTDTPIFNQPSMQERSNLCYEYKGAVNPHPSGWRVSKEKLIKMDKAGYIIWREGKRPLRKAYADEYKGKPIGSLWTDIPIASRNERTGYPTQKPIALYERIIKASSNEGDVVLDPFAGSGTTLDTAHTLGRHWIGIDQSDPSIETIIKRLRDQHGLEHDRDYEILPATP